MDSFTCFSVFNFSVLSVVGIFQTVPSRFSFFLSLCPRLLLPLTISLSHTLFSAVVELEFAGRLGVGKRRVPQQQRPDALHRQPRQDGVHRTRPSLRLLLLFADAGVVVDGPSPAARLREQQLRVHTDGARPHQHDHAPRQVEA